MLYSRRYWQELNSVVGPQTAIVKILADLSLAVSKGSPYVCIIYTYKHEILVDFNLAVLKVDCKNCQI